MVLVQDQAVTPLSANFLTDNLKFVDVRMGRSKLTQTIFHFIISLSKYQHVNFD